MQDTFSFVCLSLAVHISIMRNCTVVLHSVSSRLSASDLPTTRSSQGVNSKNPPHRTAIRRVRWGFQESSTSITLLGEGLPVFALSSLYSLTSPVRFCLPTSTLLFSFCQPLRSRARYQSYYSRSIPASEFRTGRIIGAQIRTSSRPRSANYFRKHTASEPDALNPCIILPSQIVNPGGTTIAVDTNRTCDNFQQAGFKSACKSVQILWRNVSATGRLEVSIQCRSNTVIQRLQLIVIISIANTNAVSPVITVLWHSISELTYDVTFGPIESFQSMKGSSVLHAARLSREETTTSGT
jgi:hypothetical protein